MKTTFDVLDEVYQALNVPAITSVIDGSVWRRKKPLNRQVQDVVIVPLDLRNADDVQQGIIIVNAFSRNYANGLPDETNLEAIGAAIIGALDEYELSNGTFFRVDVVSEFITQDQDDPAMSYISIRAAVQIQKES